MTSYLTLMRHISNFEAIAREISDLQRGGQGWQRGLILARKKLLSCLLDIITESDSIAEGSAQQAVRSSAVALRSRVAYHHATWPVVTIILQDADYQASSNRISAAFADLKRAIHLSN